MDFIDKYDEGILACVFDSLDRIQHMFFRDRWDIIESWYIKLDELFGRIVKKVNSRNDSDSIQLVVVSDHGFTRFDYKVNLNNWLIDHNYLVKEENYLDRNLNNVIWEKSEAYAVGLNSIYLNLEDREGEGSVRNDETNLVLHKLKEDLLAWKGPDGSQVINGLQTNTEAFEGVYSKFGPDLVVGYNTGYRASSETGMGEWGDKTLEENLSHWGADHCIDASLVPGVLFSNRRLDQFQTITYKDIPLLVINKTLGGYKKPKEPKFSDEDQEILDERLKELGYL
jgi:predicted AlkP superfamily phosphohydrolase/phosphomutase